MANLKHHPAFSLRDDAAAALNRAEDERGVIQINSAKRTAPQQQALINRWDAGGKYNRPPYLYNPARPAATSNHVRDGGVAIDTPNYQKFAQYCEAYGFRHTYPSGDPVHFEFFGIVSLPAGGTALGFSQTVQNEQNWLRVARNETALKADGLKGNATRDAYKRYQTFLRAYGYTGLIDGEWGAGTQAAHAKFYEARNKPAAPAPAAPASSFPIVNSTNVARIGDVRGLQKISRANGGKTEVDNKWEGESIKGFQNFLNRNYGGSVVTWLTKRWGYKGNDQLGPVMIAALQRANAENLRVL